MQLLELNQPLSQSYVNLFSLVQSLLWLHDIKLKFYAQRLPGFLNKMYFNLLKNSKKGEKGGGGGGGGN